MAKVGIKFDYGENKYSMEFNGNMAFITKNGEPMRKMSISRIYEIARTCSK